MQADSGCRLKEKRMELVELIASLKVKIDEADVALDSGDVDGAKRAFESCERFAR
jgi:soluble cytochrome b562